MNNFAKLFDSAKYGQLVLMLDTDDDGEPKISVYAKPPELGVCNAGLTFAGESGEENAQAVFCAMELEDAEKLAGAIFEMARRHGGAA